MNTMVEDIREALESCGNCCNQGINCHECKHYFGVKVKEGNQFVLRKSLQIALERIDDTIDAYSKFR